MRRFSTGAGLRAGCSQVVRQMEQERGRDPFQEGGQGFLSAGPGLSHIHPPTSTYHPVFLASPQNFKTRIKRYSIYMLAALK